MVLEALDSLGGLVVELALQLVELVLEPALESVELVLVLVGVLAQLLDPLDALELGPGQADLLAVVASLHAARNVQVVVLDDPQNNVTC